MVTRPSTVEPLSSLGTGYCEASAAFPKGHPYVCFPEQTLVPSSAFISRTKEVIRVSEGPWLIAFEKLIPISLSYQSRISVYTPILA